MTEAVQYSALVGIEDYIKSMTLEGLDSSRVIREAVSTDKGKSLPVITISIVDPERMPLDNGGGGNIADNYEYRFLVAIVAAKAEEERMFPLVLKWREQIISDFHLKRVSPINATVSGLEYTRVEPMAVIDRNAYLNIDLIVSAFKIVAVVRRAR